jgi:translation initiation factor 3 subunit E
MSAKLALLSSTNMVDFAMDIYKALHDTEEVPASMKERRSEVVARLRKLQAQVDPIIKCLENPNVVRNFRQDKTFNLQVSHAPDLTLFQHLFSCSLTQLCSGYLFLQFLQEDFQIGPEHVEALYQYARFQFDCGNYEMAADLLQPYRTLCTSTERNMSALWGKLASDILMQNFEAAREDINKLKDAIDNQTFAAPLVQLQQRTWLLHWSLFVFWNTEKGKDDLIDLFMSPPYLAAIQINAQHLLRYLAAAVVVHKKRRNVLKELIR